MSSGFSHPFSAEEITKLFYDWEIAPPNKQNFVLKLIANKIPWQIPVPVALEEINDPVLRIQARPLSKKLFHFRIKNTFLRLALKGNPNHYNDLEESVFQLSTLAFPESQYSEIKSELDRIANRISILFEANAEIISEELKVRLFCQVMFEEEKFVGNIQNYNDAGNSYLVQVLRTKLGIPISLSVIYLLVAQRLGLPFYGTNLPLHFLLQYDSGTYFTFVDPFHGGVLLDRTTCEKFLESNGYAISSKYFSKASTISIIKRMCRNLINVYRENQSKEMETLISEQLQILESRSTLAE